MNNPEDGFKSYWENNNLSEIIDEKIFQNSVIKKLVGDLINGESINIGKLIIDFSIKNF